MPTLASILADFPLHLSKQGHCSDIVSALEKEAFIGPEPASLT